MAAKSNGSPVRMQKARAMGQSPKTSSSATPRTPYRKGGPVKGKKR
jgi:hypothetical protein